MAVDKQTAVDMGSVCRNRSSELDSASIQTDGHDSEFLSSREALLKGSILKRVFLSEPVQSLCTAEIRADSTCLGVSIMSEPLLGGEVVNRVDQPPALQEFPPFGGRCAELEQPLRSPLASAIMQGAKS